MEIKTISSISISNFWVGHRLHNVVLRQGDLDGACGPYALTMALILSGAVVPSKVNKIWGDHLDGRTKLAKNIKELGTLVTKGTNRSNLISLFTAIQNHIGTVEIKKFNLEMIPSLNSKTPLKGLPLLKAVQQHISEKDQPVILQLDWSKSDAHWVVAIGYQTRMKNGKLDLANILILDPSEAAGKICAWNGVLGQGALNSKKLRYSFESDDPIICNASQGLAFFKNRN
jgi:hypothetical protein